MFVRAFLLALLLAVAGAPAAAAASTAEVAVAPKKPKKIKRPSAPLTCANADLVPTAANLDRIGDALACLHNLTRARGRVGTLAVNAALATAASRHADDMVARGYFEHSTPDGGHFDQRILATGYMRGANGWEIGENLIWAAGDLATPDALMSSWLDSAGHRANLLEPVYRELGLGVSFGTPTGLDGVTVAAEFGVRG